jgi:hypothetical protein
MVETNVAGTNLAHGSVGRHWRKAGNARRRGVPARNRILSERIAERLVMTIETTRRGFALPTTILLLLLMTGGVVAAFARVAADVRTIDNNRAETAAFAIAEAGLNRYVARGLMTPLDTTMKLDGGTARVRVTPVQTTVSGDSVLYIIRSDGVVAGGGASVAQGHRTVAQYAYYYRGRVRLPAMLNSFGRLSKNGSSGLVSGNDNVACSTSSVAGIASQAGMYTESGDPPPVVLGSPAKLQLPDQDALAKEVKIDWNGFTNPDMLTANVDVIVCNPGSDGYDSRLKPCGNWPSPALWAEWNRSPQYWPAILYNGSITTNLPSNGHGTLIVTGDLALGGGDTWNGIIMVGDQLTDAGTGRITGAVLTGLNALVGKSVGVSNYNGTKVYEYNSCSIANAANRQSRLVQLSNAWVDNWAAW